MKASVLPGWMTGGSPRGGLARRCSRSLRSRSLAAGRPPRGLRRGLERNQLRLGAADDVGIARLGEDQVEVAQRLDRAHDRAGIGRDQPGQGREDAVDLLLLGELRLAPAVVQVDHGQRLDEEGGAAAGLVVDQAGDASLELGSQRDDRPGAV